jgi:acetylornithine deacetylase/succinyl-diaminopimelate desuccinylase-like protein
MPPFWGPAGRAGGVENGWMSRGLYPIWSRLAPMPRSPVEAALDHAASHVGDAKASLGDLVRIPSISAEGFPPGEVRRSAEATAGVLREAGLENVRLLEMPGQHPYVYGDWLHVPGAPTLLVYGHHDVQPPGRPERWVTPAFEPAERAGRLYGRGTVDDKGTYMTHLAAVRAWLETSGRLPLNVKLLLEGEEEIGSPGLEAFLDRHAPLLAADVAVLADTGNFDVGHPALTYQLRGICQVQVEVRCLERPVHSGFWGGPVPDAVRILARLIAGLEKPDGSLNVPGLYRRVANTRGRQLRRIRSLPFDEAKFRAAAAMKRGTHFAGEKAYSVWERLWTRPSLTVIALEAHPLHGSSNQIIDSARALLSLRTVPHMDGTEAGALLVKKLTTRPPAGAEVTARVTGTSQWWTTDPEGPAFEAARRALQRGFGHEAAMIGAGGSIGFVKPFSDALGGVPCLLMGVEDPASAIHSENESLHLGDFLNGIRAAIHLYDELSRVPGGALRPAAPHSARRAPRISSRR